MVTYVIAYTYKGKDSRSNKVFIDADSAIKCADIMWLNVIGSKDFTDYRVEMRDYETGEREIIKTYKKGI